MLNVAMCACDQCTIFSTGEKFCPDYGLLLELHALTLVDRSYALLAKPRSCILLVIQSILVRQCLGAFPTTSSVHIVRSYEQSMNPVLPPSS